MDENEYTQSTLDRIHEELPKLTLHELHNVMQYVSNSTEFELIDKYIYHKVENKLYDKLKEKYPEEFI